MNCVDSQIPQVSDFFNQRYSSFSRRVNATSRLNDPRLQNCFCRADTSHPVDGGICEIS